MAEIKVNAQYISLEGPMAMPAFHRLWLWTNLVCAVRTAFSYLQSPHILAVSFHGCAWQVEKNDSHKLTLDTICPTKLSNQGQVGGLSPPGWGFSGRDMTACVRFLETDLITGFRDVYASIYASHLRGGSYYLAVPWCLVAPLEQPADLALH